MVRFGDTADRYGKAYRCCSRLVLVKAMRLAVLVALARVGLERVVWACLVSLLFLYAFGKRGDKLD